MKTLKRNETTFTYKAFKEKTEKLLNGKHTGKMSVSYEEPVEYTGNISAPSGQTNTDLFGIDVKYTHVLIMDDPTVDIKEDGLILWKGDAYEVKAVRPSLNVLAVALKQCVGGVVE